jgi:hypothetical protein
MRGEDMVARVRRSAEPVSSIQETIELETEGEPLTFKAQRKSVDLLELSNTGQVEVYLGE